MVDKKNSVLIAIASIVLLAALSCVAVFAWLSNSLQVKPDIQAHIHKSYFESGDGTGAEQFIDGLHESDEGCAFEIKYPVQLYYFAWLQALGYFNTPEEGTTSINQVYFYLSDDLDMTGYVLPPIGTEEYPFVGNFDGNSHTISNLTVQNIETSNGQSWTDTPELQISESEIVGFFGVIGSLTSIGGTDKTSTAAIENGTDFQPAQGYTYSS